MLKVGCQQLLPESSRLAVPQTLTMEKLNVVSALSTLNVAPNTKGKEKIYRTRQKSRHLGWPGSGANPFPLHEVSQLSHKNPIFWQITASFGNISSSYIATMHMLMRGIINYTLIGEASIPLIWRPATKLWKRNCVEIGHSWTLRCCGTTPLFLKLH